ncbi:hypothetical protein L7F22_001873 [Adiantum nelumboides]|nr:hypothetical protein [Adiantum nelumboides]
MPELPEVEAARKAVHESCCGRRILQASVANDTIVIDRVEPSVLESALVGRSILGAHRKGKNLWLELDARPWPSFQFGMKPRNPDTDETFRRNSRNGKLMDGYREEGSSSQDRQSIPIVREVGEGSSQAEEGFPHAAFSITGTASLGTMFGWKKQNDQADTIEKRLLSGDFWEKVEKYVKVLWLVMVMLRVVDRDQSIMGVVYEAIDQMLEQIKEILKEDKDGTLMYEEIHEFAQVRWDMLHSPLHATAFLLNAILFSKKPYNDKEVMKGWRKTLDRVGRDEAEKTTLKNYGTGALELQRLAICVLSQVSSASACERNWSTYGFIHSLKCNRLGHIKADDLVYVHSNLRLISRKQPCYLSGPCKAWDVLEDDSSWDASFEDEDEDDEMFPSN